MEGGERWRDERDGGRRREGGRDGWMEGSREEKSRDGGRDKKGGKEGGKDGWREAGRKKVGMGGGTEGGMEFLVNFQSELSF